VQVEPRNKFPSACQHKIGMLAIIIWQHSEVWLDRIRETYGYGQGSWLSG
jgi:hypothetical protein